MSEQPSEPLNYNVCRRQGGGCLALYGTTVEQVDEWVKAKKVNGDTVTTFSDSCDDICNRAHTSGTSLENGVTGVRITGRLPKGTIVDNLPAIALIIEGEYKVRPIK